MSRRRHERGHSLYGLTTLTALSSEASPVQRSAIGGSICYLGLVA